ncbi:MAG: VWA domain-containing protein, partial [Planctomycetota bacterium]|nr:VWA domain-containing protein [Planctomycetota bacterium]
SQKGSKKAAGEWIRTLLAFRSALQRLLRVDLPAAIDWKNYVDSRQDDDLFRSPEERQHGRTALTLFGAEVSGKNIVFVVDVSGSMRTTDPEPPGGRKGPRGKTVVGDPAERDPESAAKAAERRRRITRAKKELGRVIRSLPEDVRFNVVAFSSDVTSWKPALVPASRGNKKRATSFVGGLEAEGITVTDMALEEAFGDLELDTVYLITDGAPTHVGSTGRGLPEDARELMELILERMKVLNFLRDVRIFSLGFQGAEEDFLKKLSREHGGRYVRID